MKYQQINISRKILPCLFLLFFVLMSASVTYAENYLFVNFLGDKESAANGSMGSGNGQFNCPCDVAVDSSGNVYVADSGNSRIQKFNRTGGYLTKWGSYGQAYDQFGIGRFNGPIGDAVDLSGNIYVSDVYSSRIEKFSSNGNFITNWGSFGSGNGQFNFPSSVAVDSSGNVYVADNGNSRIQKFKSDGE